MFKIDKLPDDFTGKAEDSEGTIRYYKNGKLHREDGPALITADGKIKEHWLEGVFTLKEEFTVTFQGDVCRVWWSHLSGKFHIKECIKETSDENLAKTICYLLNLKKA